MFTLKSKNFLGIGIRNGSATLVLLWLALVLLVASAIAVRVYNIQEEPLIFHPVKQYRSAMTARAIYYDATTDGSIPEWKHSVANANLRDIGILQPPIESSIAAFIYGLAGREALWMPRLFLALSWMVGGAFIFLLARRLTTRDAALVSLAFYLLLPFGVVASRSFQVDGLMVTVTVAGLYMLVRYDQSKSFSDLLISALVTAAAILLKPVSAFILFAGFAGLCLSAKHPFQTLFSKQTFIFIAISLFPAVLYYAYGIFVVQGVLQQQASKSFVPAFFSEFRFWDGWQKRIGSSIGFTYFLAGLVGVLLYRGRTRIFLTALWIGYFLMCLAFNYTISTHDYYHLLLVPIVALSLGSLANLILTELNQAADSWHWRLAAMTILTLALFLAAGTSVQAERKQQTSDTQIRLAQEIGRAIDHSTQTIYLAQEQGHSLLYYGEFSGLYWPYRYDIRDEQLWQGYALTAEERFKRLNDVVQAEYFVVADLAEYVDQPEIKQLLTNRFPVYKQTDEYLIFRLE